MLIVHVLTTRCISVIHAEQHSFLVKVIQASAEGGGTAILEQILSTWLRMDVYPTSQVSNRHHCKDEREDQVLPANGA
jgi:hypothetical protein